MAGASGSGPTEHERVGAHAGAHGAPNTAPACATTPMLADLGVLYGGRGRLLRVAEIADQLGVSTATVYNLCAASELPHIRVVDSIRVRPNDLAAFVKGRLVENPKRLKREPKRRH
jgi:excisionase family DNA binding protein